MPTCVCVLRHCSENSFSRIKCWWIDKRDPCATTVNDYATRHVTSFFSEQKSLPLVRHVIIAILPPLICAIPAATLAAPLSKMEFTALASRCAPAVPAETLEAVARTESGLDPLVLHDNTTGQHEETGNLDDAVAEAGEWVGHGDSVDIGLMQINSANLAPLGMTVADAVDPCASLAGGAEVLRAAYGGGSTQAEQQAALLMALSRYNTGTPFQGIMNGYARTVLENAGKGDEALPIPLSPAQIPLFVDPNAPPAWNVSAAGAYAQMHGASWLISLAPSVSDQRLQARPMRPGPPADAIASN